MLALLVIFAALSGGAALLPQNSLSRTRFFHLQRSGLRLDAIAEPVAKKPLTVRRELLKNASIRLKPKKKLSFEERYDHDPLRADSPTVDHIPPVDPFTKWYLCFGAVDSAGKLRKRQEVWTHHIQWARRSVLAQGLRGAIVAAEMATDTDEGKKEPEEDDEEVVEVESAAEVEAKKAESLRRLRALVPSAMVEGEYTLLSTDCLKPEAQVMSLRANNSKAVLEYLQQEPLQQHGAVSGWQVFEVKWEKNSEDKDEDEDWIVPLDADVYDPYMFLSLFEGGPSQVEKKKLLDDSRTYHIAAATTTAEDDNQEGKEPYSALYKNCTRMISLGRLHSVEDDAVAGQMAVLNARSRADALRYISRDPIADSQLQDSEFQYSHLGMSAVNLQDVNGLHHMMAKSFGELSQLEQIHFQDPEDVLTEGEAQGLREIKGLPAHFEQNRQTLQALGEHSVSYRYAGEYGGMGTFQRGTWERNMGTHGTECYVGCAFKLMLFQPVSADSHHSSLISFFMHSLYYSLTYPISPQLLASQPAGHLQHLWSAPLRRGLRFPHR
mmetsp:Transcript_21795/g.48683  ORF Transcript_21795/g.48683 Transcript_21795/m.48683 type:complete len:551 (+) Transcript_21795:104-1756(+)